MSRRLNMRASRSYLTLIAIYVLPATTGSAHTFAAQAGQSKTTIDGEDDASILWLLTEAGRTKPTRSDSQVVDYREAPADPKDNPFLTEAETWRQDAIKDGYKLDIQTLLMIPADVFKRYELENAKAQKYQNNHVSWTPSDLSQFMRCPKCFFDRKNKLTDDTMGLKFALERLAHKMIRSVHRKTSGSALTFSTAAQLNGFWNRRLDETERPPFPLPFESLFDSQTKTDRELLRFYMKLFTKDDKSGATADDLWGLFERAVRYLLITRSRPPNVRVIESPRAAVLDFGIHGTEEIAFYLRPNRVQRAHSTATTKQRDITQIVDYKYGPLLEGPYGAHAIQLAMTNIWHNQRYKDKAQQLLISDLSTGETYHLNGYDEHHLLEALWFAREARQVGLYAPNSDAKHEHLPLKNSSQLKLFNLPDEDPAWQTHYGIALLWRAQSALGRFYDSCSWSGPHDPVFSGYTDRKALETSVHQQMRRRRSR